MNQCSVDFEYFIFVDISCHEYTIWDILAEDKSKHNI